MPKRLHINQVSRAGLARRAAWMLPAGVALQAAALMLLSLTAAAQPAPNAQPNGGVAVGGSASISRGANITTIDQSTQRAAINWQSFNVGSQQLVTFEQPSLSASTLNRVTGPDPSQIAGRIDANGQVVIVNQSGITFYKGAQVNTAGLVASTAGVTNQNVQNFVNGGGKALPFDQAGSANAQISNAGTITVANEGLAALVAPSVTNSGVISARLGHIVLAGAKTATVDLTGDQLVSLAVTGKVTQAPVGSNGSPVAKLVSSTGTIIADGGTVRLTAQAVDGVVQTLLQADGTIEANSVGAKTGKIVLNGVGGKLVVDGTLLAQGNAPGTTGGNIEVDVPGDVVVKPTATIDASGQAGGGVVAIGTTLARARGGPSVTSKVTAANTTIASGAQIAANATGAGNGGTVSVLSTGQTSMAGSISAEGGSQSGNGGKVEVSGQTLSLTGQIDVTAPHGNTGTILLDPGGK